MDTESGSRLPFPEGVRRPGSTEPAYVAARPCMGPGVGMKSSDSVGDAGEPGAVLPLPFCLEDDMAKSRAVGEEDVMEVGEAATEATTSGGCCCHCVGLSTVSRRAREFRGEREGKRQERARAKHAHR
jgi:hypothetical protein